MICLTRAELSLKMFDIVVAFIEKHNGRTFPQNQILKCRDALLEDLRKLFPTPEAEAIPVAMETGNEDLAPEGYQRIPRHTVMVQRWPIAKLLQDYLLDLQLFGNKLNLVNVQDPFGKYVPQNPDTDRELLAGQWYSRTWDAKIADPAKEFLLVLELYLDKTGRTASLKSYCGEPVIMSTPLLNQACRQNARAWRLLGLIEDLDTYSSAKKSQQSGRKKEKGRTMRDYHNILRVILQELIGIQQDGGICLYVRMGEEVRYVKVIPVMSIITGDAKSGDNLCCRFMGKNCKGRVPRLCMTPLGHLDDPMRECRLVRSTDLQTLYQRATDETLSNKERASYHSALTEMSTHLVDSPLYQLDYGSNDIGVTMATATDMMHAFESGILPHLLKVFMASMTMSVWVRMDELVEKLFLPCAPHAGRLSPLQLQGWGHQSHNVEFTSLAGHGIYLPCRVAHRRGNESLRDMLFHGRCRRARLWIWLMSIGHLYSTRRNKHCCFHWTARILGMESPHRMENAVQ